jgi:hypothetical protein
MFMKMRGLIRDGNSSATTTLYIRGRRVIESSLALLNKKFCAAEIVMQVSAEKN